MAELPPLSCQGPSTARMSAVDGESPSTAPCSLNLDDPQRYPEVDRADALGDVERTADQWVAARALPVGTYDPADFGAIVIVGMGGSGIAGDVAAAIAADSLGVPVLVHKGFRLPGFVSRNTLVVVISYSGDTEEALAAFEEARRRSARMLAITSGGVLAASCAAAGVDCVLVPGGGQPRHSLGYLVVPVLTALGLDGGLDDAMATLRHVAWGCDRALPTAENPAKRLGARLAMGGSIAVYGGQGIGAVAAYRLKCQLNENAKLAASVSEFPELNHNEVVGWQDGDVADIRSVGDRTIVWVRDPAGEDPRVVRRTDIVMDLVAGRAAWQDSITSRGEAPLARLASLLLIADLISVYAALARGVDPTPIELIARLKEMSLTARAAGGPMR